MKTLLVDADIIAYQAGTTVERNTQWSTFLWTRHADFDEAVALLDNQIEELRVLTEADRVILALTDDTNFRKAVLPSYKANRASTPKPVVHAALREYVHEKYETFQRPGLEGDDVLGILHTRTKEPGEETILWSIDKDMLQIPGKHWRENGLITVTKDQGDYLHATQTLTGDTVDGYSGCPGVGPVKADKLLEGLHPDNYWKAIVTAYEKAGLTEADALTQARVARICQASDYDFIKREVKLWTPT
jgi:DNA polymerase I